MLVELIRDLQGWIVALDLALVAVLVGLVVAEDPPRGGPHGWLSLSTAEGRFRIGALAAGVLSVVAATLVIPSLTGHLWIGHEGLYLDVFEGRPNPEASPSLYLTTPLLRFVYRGMSLVPGLPPASMVVLNVLAGALSVLAVAGIVRRVSGDAAAAVIAAFLVALQPTHAFWSTSAYHVMLPFALAQCALLVLLQGAHRRSMRLIALSAVLGPLAVAGRAETVLFLPAGLALVLLIEGRKLRKAAGAALPGIALGAVLTAAFLAPMIGPMLAGEGAEWTPDLLVGLVRQNLLWLHLWTPYDHVAAWPLILIGLVALLRAGRDGLIAVAGLILLLLAFHLPYSHFSDYAPRHAMVGAASLAALAGAGVTATWRAGWARYLGIILLIALLLPTAAALLEVRQRYHAPPEVLLGAVDPRAWDKIVDLDDYLAQDCAVIADDPIWALDSPTPHLHLTHPLVGPQLWQDSDGCILWLHDASNVVWNSTDVHERAHRLHHLFEWELLGSVRVDYGYPAAVYRMEGWPGAPPR